MLKKYFSAYLLFTSSILVRKRSVEKVGLFDKYCQPAEDWDMWLRCEEAHLRGGYLDIPLAYYMKTKNSLTTSRKYKMISSGLMVAIKHANILGLQNKKVRRSLGEFYFKKADIYFNEHNAYIRVAFYFAMRGFYYFPNITKILKGLRVMLKQINPHFGSLKRF